MVYKCLRCHYTTNIKCNYDRHKTRKTQCVDVGNTIDGNKKSVNVCDKNVNVCQKSVNADRISVNVGDDNHIPVIISEGSRSKQCIRCKKTFSTRQGVYQHMKNVDCVPPPPPPPPKQAEMKQLQNNNHIQDTTFNGDLSMNNTMNNIVVNTFGKEEIAYMKENNNLLKEFLQISKKSIYGCADIVKEIHCNKNRPENHTIIKPLEYGDSVYIMGDNNEWEFREFEDVRDTLIDSVNNYIELCEEKRSDKDTNFNKIESHFVKELCLKLVSIGGDIPLMLMDALKMRLSDESLNTDNIRKFDKATMIKLHEFTQANYKKNNGTFIRN